MPVRVEEVIYEKGKAYWIRDAAYVAVAQNMRQVDAELVVRLLNDDWQGAQFSTECGQLRDKLADTQAELASVTRLHVRIGVLESWQRRAADALRHAAAIYRHKSIEPLMLPGVQDRMEQEAWKLLEELK